MSLTRQNSWQVPGSQQMQSQKALTVPRVVKPGFPITLHFRCTKYICRVLLHHPNPFRKRRAERTQLHLQRRRWKFRRAPKKSALAFSLPPTPHPIRSSLPSLPPSSSPFIKYLLHAKFHVEHVYYTSFHPHYNSVKELSLSPFHRRRN